MAESDIPIKRGLPELGVRRPWLVLVLNLLIAIGGIAALQAGVFAMFRPSRPVEPGRAKGPARLQVLRIVGVRSLLVTCLCFMSAFYGAYALLGHHMRETLGISASAASMAALTYGIGFGLGGARRSGRPTPPMLTFSTSKKDSSSTTALGIGTCSRFRVSDEARAELDEGKEQQHTSYTSATRVAT